MDSERRITSADDVTDDDTVLFTVREVATGEKREAFLIRLNGEVACWLNYCPHWTDVNLDKGSGAAVRNGEVVCQKHGATFEPDSGYCNFGPCEGAYLDGIAVTLEAGYVYLIDDEYEFVTLGAEETGDLSTSPGERLGF